jgi:hypothetical protein
VLPQERIDGMLLLKLMVEAELAELVEVRVGK